MVLAIIKRPRSWGLGEETETRDKYYAGPAIAPSLPLDKLRTLCHAQPRPPMASASTTSLLEARTPSAGCAHQQQAHALYHAQHPARRCAAWTLDHAQPAAVLIPSLCLPPCSSLAAVHACCHEFKFQILKFPSPVLTRVHMQWTKLLKRHFSTHFFKN